MTTIIGNFLALAMHVAAAITPAAPASEDASYDAAVKVADQCETATSWAEYVGGGLWRGVCGNDSGEELINATAEERAVLHYHMALSAGKDADAAYEDAIARDNALDAKGLLPCYTEGK